MEELVVFDPTADRHPRSNRSFLQHFVYDDQGRLVQTAVTDAEPVHSPPLGAWLVIVTTDRGRRLRLSHGPNLRQLIPTSDEGLAEATALLEHINARTQEMEDELERQRDVADEAWHALEQARAEAERERNARAQATEREHEAQAEAEEALKTAQRERETAQREREARLNAEREVERLLALLANRDT